jgi:hypothetical protein
MNTELLHKIATKVHNSPKAKKDAVFAAIQALIHATPVDECGNLDNLAALYSYFLPTSPKSPKTPEQWVNKAVAKADVRQYLNQAYSDGSTFVATCGGRLHAIRNFNRPEGYYDLAGNRLNLDYKYPAFERVIPFGSDQTYSAKSTIMRATIMTFKDRGGEFIQIIELNGSKFTATHVLDALSGFTDGPIGVFQHDNRSTLRLTQGDMVAVLMPLFIPLPQPAK